MAHSLAMSTADALDHLHVFIMAGGSGERFWPMSRAATPKHLLRLLSERTMLETTVLRMQGLVPWERVFILTAASQLDAIRREVPFLPPQNIIAEPAKRDTAPACALATGFARARDPRAICALFPADAMIHDIDTFREQIRTAALAAASRSAILTVAIPPQHPSTAFGYLHLADEKDGISHVDKFVEKPDLPTAEKYLASGYYAWNAGIFLWQASVFLDESRRQLPELAAFIESFPAGDPAPYLADKFPALPKKSVDYAIMEHAASVLAIRARFDWDDVGSWTSLPSHLGSDDSGNTFKGDVHSTDAKNNIVIANSRVVALCGVQDLIVIETPDAILVAHRDSAQDIKALQQSIPHDIK